MRTKKRLGQHFLVNRGVVDHILDSLELVPGEPILEIGPGPGTLTFPLHERGFASTVVEVDQDMVAHLRSHPCQPPLRIICADFMTLSLDEVVLSGTKVVSNLPYNLSVPITARLLERADAIPLMVMMYQREVAERIRASPGTKDYGPISVLVQSQYAIDRHFNVKPGSFRPPPKVDSQVIRLRRLNRPLIEISALPRLTELLRFIFTYRRKTLGRILKGWQGNWTNREALLESLAECGVASNSRPESLAIEDFVAWFRKIGPKDD